MAVCDCMWCAVCGCGAWHFNSCSVRQCGSVRHSMRQCVAVLAAVSGCLVIRAAVCGCPAQCWCTSVRQCVRMCAAVRGCVRQCVWQCVAVIVAVCGSACGSVLRLSRNACGSVRLSGSMAVCSSTAVCIFRIQSKYIRFNSFKFGINQMIWYEIKSIQINIHVNSYTFKQNNSF
jgi:hypothetical protein